MTESQRDRAITELVWLWVGYPGACYPPSIMEKMVYGLLVSRISAGESIADIMTQMHADALDIRAAFDRLTARQRSILRLAYNPSNGPMGSASDRVRSAYFRQDGSVYSRSQCLERAEGAIVLAVAAYARARGIR